MKLIIHRDGIIGTAHDWSGEGLLLNSVGAETVEVRIDDELWEKVKENPENYIYKNGKLEVVKQKSDNNDKGEN